MPTQKNASETSFATEFLIHYLKNGLGSMSKSDIDALVMHLLDKHYGEASVSLGQFSNQIVSERLRTSVSKIKRARYEAGLKYAGRPEDVARERFLICLGRAGIEFEKNSVEIEKIVFIIEDILAKNWVQEQIKNQSGIFDSSFNSEIIKVEPGIFFKILEEQFSKSDIESFQRNFEEVKKKKDRKAIVKAFKELLGSFFKGAAQAAGASTVKAILPLPL